MEPLISDTIVDNRKHERAHSLSLTESKTSTSSAIASTPLFSGSRQRHWSTGTGTQPSSSASSSSGNSLESLREKLEKSDYVVVRRKRLGVFHARSRHESLERTKKRTSSEGDGLDGCGQKDLFGSTKALRDSFKSVSFAQKAKLIHLGSYERRGSAPVINSSYNNAFTSSLSSTNSSPATSNPNLLNSGQYYSESEVANVAAAGKVVPFLRGILKSSSRSGSESSLNLSKASSTEKLAATIVKTHYKITASKSSGESGSNSPSSANRSRCNSYSGKENNEEKLFLVKTITKKIGGNGAPVTSPTASVAAAAFTGAAAARPTSTDQQQQLKNSISGESDSATVSANTELQLRRSRYGMQKSLSLGTTARRKISNCPEEDETEALRKDSTIKVVRKKKRSRDEQRDKRLSRKEEHQQQQALAAMANSEKSQAVAKDLSPGKITNLPDNDKDNHWNNQEPVIINEQLNGHHNEINHVDVPLTAAKKEEPSSGKVSTSGIDTSRSEEDLDKILRNELNVSVDEPEEFNSIDNSTSATAVAAAAAPEPLESLDANNTNNQQLIMSECKLNNQNNDIRKLNNYAVASNNYRYNYKAGLIEGDDGFDDEMNDKISSIDTSFSQSFSNTNYDFSFRRQSDSSFTESFKHLQPFNFDLEPIKEGKRERLYKVLVVGELGTGKTSVIKRYVHQFFSQHYRATIGVDFALKVLRWDPETVVRLQLWDIAGQERFGSMTRVYYKEAVGAFVVFDVTRAATLEAVPKWKADLDSKVVLPDGRPIPTVLLANKCDQPREGIAANKEKMNEFCQQQGFTNWFETSAKDNTNIDEAANFLVSKILEIDRWSQEPINSDPEKVDLGGANGKHRVVSNNCAC